jgi:hypothetical protein
MKPKKVPPDKRALNVRLSPIARERVREAAHVARCSEQAFIERFAMTLPPAPGEPTRSA